MLTEIKYLTVKDFVNNGSIVIENIDTDNMIVDHLTKGLRLAVFSRHVESIGVIRSFDALV